MERKRSVLLFCFYILGGFLALGLTWAHVPSYFQGPDGSMLGFPTATLNFWKDAFLNGNQAGIFLALDVLMLAWVMNVWMVIEGRKLGIKYIWAYILGGVFVAISFTCPLFLAARERQLAKADVEVSNPEPRTGDLVGLAIIGLATVGAGVYLI